jgi:hypothetical protein
MTPEQSSSALYPQLLGDAWFELDEGVKRLHISSDRENVEAVGIFRVWHGRGWLAHLLLLPMPPAAEATAMRLTVTDNERGEKWSRMFGNRPLVSTQSKGPDGLLLEHMGLVELQFRLEVIDGALHYKSTGAALRAGRLRFPLPRWASPQVTARESRGDSLNGAHVFVSVTAPSTGLLLSYEGYIEAEKL